MVSNDGRKHHSLCSMEDMPASHIRDPTTQVSDKEASAIEITNMGNTCTIMIHLYNGLLLGSY